MDNHISHLTLKTYLAIFLLPLILINYLRNLKVLAPLTTFANMITLGSFGIIGYYVFFRSDLSFSHVEAVGPLSDFPLFFGTVLFALEAVGVVTCFSYSYLLLLLLPATLRMRISFHLKINVLSISKQHLDPAHIFLSF